MSQSALVKKLTAKCLCAEDFHTNFVNTAHWHPSQCTCSI